MRDDHYAGYREYLREGMRIEVGIPLSEGGVFRDWAIVSDSGGEELLVQISRDQLPANVRVDVGFILDVSLWVKKEVYTCSGIVTEKTGGRLLRIRLFGIFTLRERRQFFRIDLNLRLRYALLSSPDKRDVERDWEQRRDLGQMKFQGYDDFVIAAQMARHTPAVRLEWHEMPWAEVNLGGGGLFIALPEPVQPDQLLALEIHLPFAPPRQVQTVVQVMHVMAPKVQKDGIRFQAGMQFKFLDERDRDLIFRHISVTQIEYLRNIADRRAVIEPAPTEAPPQVRWQQVVRQAGLTLLFLVLLFYLVRYLIHYQQAAPPNEIQQTYEKAIRQYRHEKK